ATRASFQFFLKLATKKRRRRRPEPGNEIPADFSRALADLAVSGCRRLCGQSLRFAIWICKLPGLTVAIARLAYLEGGDNMVVGSSPEELGMPVNRVRCSSK
ncbi:MAG: hypothetical protein WBW81_06955, partial [Methylocella sp.]